MQWQEKKEHVCRHDPKTHHCYLYFISPTIFDNSAVLVPVSVNLCCTYKNVIESNVFDGASVVWLVALGWLHFNSHCLKF